MVATKNDSPLLSPASSMGSPAGKAQGIVVPKAPEPSWLDRVMISSLQKAPGYRLDVSHSTVKLDQNECPWDVPRALKDRICERLKEAPWNRYPSAFSEDLCDLLAQHAGVGKGSVLLGPGSNYLLSLLVTTLTKKILSHNGEPTGPRLWLARPSFPHCEALCAYEGIPFVPWNLTDDFEYDEKALAGLTPGSVVIFATPNNPVGNSLKGEALSRILKAHPETLFIADEAYYEYSDVPLTYLLEQFSNLILVRTFSKTMASASVRIGYLLASSEIIDQLRKLRPPFLLNAFQNIALEEMLKGQEMGEHVRMIVSHTKRERDRLFERFLALGTQLGMTTKVTEANFFLLKWDRPENALMVYQHLLSQSIQVRNVSGAPRLAGCLRVTIGTAEENDSLLKALASWQPPA